MIQDLIAEDADQSAMIFPKWLATEAEELGNPAMIFPKWTGPQMAANLPAWLPSVGRSGLAISILRTAQIGKTVTSSRIDGKKMRENERGREDEICTEEGEVGDSGLK